METSRIASAMSKHEKELIAKWISDIKESAQVREELMGEADLREHCKNLIEALIEAINSGAPVDKATAGWAELEEQIQQNANQLARRGFRPSEAMALILLLKQPLFELLTREIDAKERQLESGDVLIEMGRMLDRIGLVKVEAFYETQQQIIRRQQAELLELSTPVIELADGILALPLIGTLDSMRAQIVMESLLEKIVETRASTAIIDITGVPTVDTMVAQHLLKAASATRLMGANCIISGISPRIAQTIVQLGVNLDEVTTKANLASAFREAIAHSESAGVEQVDSTFAGVREQGGGR